MVLMEPKWNVKQTKLSDDRKRNVVLMEPKWNVKLPYGLLPECRVAVLMEPKWNVKHIKLIFGSLFPFCINGTKVECKGISEPNSSL